MAEMGQNSPFLPPVRRGSFTSISGLAWSGPRTSAVIGATERRR
jgi:hypothetical protein